MATTPKGGGARSGGGGTLTAAQNRRASFDFHLGDRFEAGLVLTGSEVKSLRGGRGSLVGAWVKLDPAGEAWLMQCHIPEYSHGGYANHDPIRPRKLLLHRRELDRLRHEVGAKGVTLVPTRIHFREGLAKLEFAVGRGKDAADKRRAVAKRDAEREMDRARAHRGRRG
jgi:SsrA-binding protein